MSKLELILLGQFECLLPSGTRISLSMRKAEVLLAYLALTPGLRHPRERLINLLWSDRSEEQARNSLRQCLSAIKKSLGDVADMVLQVDRTTVSLIPELIDIDVHEFERLATEGDYESLTTAADLYQGEFLEGISIRDASCQEWLDSERGRFKRQFIEILSELAETQLLSHDFGKAIKSSERLVKQDSLGESGWRLLMRAYFDNGDRSHALQAFKRCQQALREELDVEPELATIELRDRIAVGETKPAHAPTTDIGEPPLDTLAPTGDNLGESSIDPSTSTAHSIAVLPFDNLSGDPEQEYFSDGITDSIILNLSMFPGLQVKSRNSSFAFKQQIKSLGEISQELNVDYVVEGSIRKSRDRIRITVQLIEAATGNQVWGKRYDAEIENLFDLEEELSRTIAATVTGQIETDLQRIAIAKSAADQQSYDLLLGGTYHTFRFNRQDNVIAIEKLNQCLVQDPDNVRAHAMLYTCHGMDYLERWTLDYRASFKLAEDHIRKALALDPELVLVQALYAEYLVFCGKAHEAALHLEKALTINPNDPDALTTKSLSLTTQGDFESALQSAERACQLDPYHPWAEWELAAAQFLSGRYEVALETMRKFRTEPGFTKVFFIAVNIKLDRIDVARETLPVFLQQCRENMLSMPQTLDEWLSYFRDTYQFADPSINQDLLDCLVQAGLEDERLSNIQPGEINQQPTILVLPFSNLSGDPEQEYFSNGITESIILNLSSFSGLKVKSRHTSFAYQDSAKSIEELAADLAVQYIVEGSIRKFGDKVRITVQLDETDSGNQLWGKRFESDLEDLFSLEEELVQTIAGTISGRIGKDIKSAALHKSAKDLKSYDYLMRGLYHLEKFTAADNRIAREQFLKSIEHDPGNAEAHAILGETYVMELYENWTADRDEARRLMEVHATRAIELEPDNALVHAFMAEQLLISRDFERSAVHAARAIELNPTLPDGYSMQCGVMGSIRRYDEALEYADISLQIDPYHPYIGWNAGEVYRSTGQYERALKAFRSIPHISPSLRAQTAASLAGMDKEEEARAEMQRYLELAHEQMPSYPASENEWRALWYEGVPYQFEEDSKTLFDLLLKAGLCDEITAGHDDIPSIAVLPFENMSGDPEQEYFSDGITNDIVTTLSHIRRLRVVARHSTLIYKDHKPSISDIANEQGVRYILDGSVRKSGKRIRVNAQLIDSETGENCWAENYDRKMKDIFAVQDEITRNIAVEMQVHLISGDAARKTSIGTTSFEAWELVTMAWDLQDSYIKDNMLKAQQLVDKALKLDPEYSSAWVTLGWTHWQGANTGLFESIDDSIREAGNAADKALAIDPENAEALVLKGCCHISRNEPELAIEACSKAVEISPGDAEVQALTSYTYNFTGEYDKALPHHEASLRLCPICPNWFLLVGGTIYQHTGDLEKAIEMFRKGVEVEPESPLCRYYLIDALMDAGRETEAQAYADEIRALGSSFRISGMLLSHSHDKDVRERYRANLKKVGLDM